MMIFKCVRHGVCRYVAEMKDLKKTEKKFTPHKSLKLCFIEYCWPQQTKKTLGKLRAEMRVIRTFAHSGKM